MDYWKLIELHNEYRTTVFWKKIREWEKNDLWPIEILISKNYAFIKRLVENDKIDFDKFKAYNYENWYGKWERELQKIYYYWKARNEDLNYTEWYSEVEELLMLLSIQDNSIEFLVSILK